MMVFDTIWIIAAALLAIAALLWCVLLVSHAAAERKERRIARYQDAWFALLLPVMDEDLPLPALPKPARREEMEAVLGLLRELAERFRGQYRDRLSAVLDQIDAPAFGCRLLRSGGIAQRVRGAALLAWCSPSEASNAALEHALGDRDPRVRLEASMGLVRKGLVTDPVPMLKALCRDRAAHSLLARDAFRILGKSASIDWSPLLQRTWSVDAWVLLLEAAGAAGRPDWTPWIAAQTRHGSALVARTALAALETLGDPQGETAALDASAHANPSLRRQAARTLAACGTLDTCVGALDALLADPSFEVRRAALKGLLALGGRPRLLDRPPADAWQRELFLEAGLIAPETA